MEVDFKPRENFLDKERYNNTTTEFTIEDFFSQERDGKTEWRLILNNVNTKEDNEDLRCSNKLAVALQNRYGKDTEKWKNQHIQLKFSDWFNKDGQRAGVTVELV
jgi:hypothetical protein